MVNVCEIRSEQGGGMVVQGGGTVVDSHHALYLQACDIPSCSIVLIQLTGSENYSL